MKHLRYLRYVVLHKWFVFIACLRYGLIWQGIVHDWSKFLPSEWFPYVESFQGRGKALREIQKKTPLSFMAKRELTRIEAAFDVAWLKHQRRSPHHWQHWILREDSGAVKVLEMPPRFALEMVADWTGAGRAITGKRGGTPGWYLNNRDRIQLHPSTRQLVERELGINSQEIHANYAFPQ